MNYVLSSFLFYDRVDIASTMPRKALPSLSLVLLLFFGGYHPSDCSDYESSNFLQYGRITTAMNAPACVVVFVVAVLLAFSTQLCFAEQSCAPS
jgi:hypothetical protein